MLIPKIHQFNKLPCGCEFTTYSYDGLAGFFCHVVKGCNGQTHTVYETDGEMFDDMDDALRRRDRTTKPSAPKFKVVHGGLQ